MEKLKEDLYNGFPKYVLKFSSVVLSKVISIYMILVIGTTQWDECALEIGKYPDIFGIIES